LNLVRNGTKISTKNGKNFNFFILAIFVSYKTKKRHHKDLTLLFEKENTTLSGMCQKFQRNLEKMSILSILAIFVSHKTGKRHHRDSLLFKKENDILKSAHTHLSRNNDFLASHIVSDCF